MKAKVNSFGQQKIASSVLEIFESQDPSSQFMSMIQLEISVGTAKGWSWEEETEEQSNDPLQYSNREAVAFNNSLNNAIDVTYDPLTPESAHFPTEPEMAVSLPLTYQNLSGQPAPALCHLHSKS